MVATVSRLACSRLKVPEVKNGDYIHSYATDTCNENPSLA